MRFVWIAWGLAGMLVISNPGYAQQGRGDNEIQVQGTLSIGTSSNQSDFGAVEGKYGRFVTANQQVGVEVTAFLLDQHKLAGYGGPFYRYNFSTGKVVPYLGVAAAASFGSFGTGKGGRLDFEGGFRYFLDRRTAFTAAATTAYTFDDHSFGKDLEFLFGFSHLWGR